MQPQGEHSGGLAGLRPFDKHDVISGIGEYV